MEATTAMEFVRAQRQGVLTTVRRDGRPQLSNIIYTVDETGVIRISITAGQAKAKNLLHDPRAALYVTSDDFWSYAVVEGAAELSPVAADPHDATVNELVALYQSMSGEHPDWDEYRAAMVADRRLVVRLAPTSAYGMLPGAR